MNSATTSAPTAVRGAIDPRWAKLLVIWAALLTVPLWRFYVGRTARLRPDRKRQQKESGQGNEDPAIPKAHSNPSWHKPAAEANLWVE